MAHLFTQIAGGVEHAMILLKISEELEQVIPAHADNEGRALVMGSCDHGQLGNGDLKVRRRRRRRRMMMNDDVIWLLCFTERICSFPPVANDSCRTFDTWSK